MLSKLRRIYDFFASEKLVAAFTLAVVMGVLASATGMGSFLLVSWIVAFVYLTVDFALTSFTRS